MNSHWFGLILKYWYQYTRMVFQFKSCWAWPIFMLWSLAFQKTVCPLFIELGYMIFVTSFSSKWFFSKVFLPSYSFWPFDLSVSFRQLLNIYLKNMTYWRHERNKIGIYIVSICIINVKNFPSISPITSENQ